MYFHLDFKCGTGILFLLDIITESEKSEGIPSSVMHITDDLFFLRYHFEKLQVYNALLSWIHQWEQPHKTLKIITRTVDFGIPTIKIFLSIKIFWRTVGIIEILRSIQINIQEIRDDLSC